METYNPLLIAIDPGHGGNDPGAQWENRLEKDDTLRLALILRDILVSQGIDVLLTREQDIAISPQERVRMVNNSDAELLLSLHRGFCQISTPTCNGVENIIYLTAPEATTGHAAELVLNHVSQAGVQANRGVHRGNSYLLRRTEMPAMMLNIGYINNATDNQLFDQRLQQYAEAIAQGVLEYFGLNTAEPPACPTPPADNVPPIPPAPPIVVPLPTVPPSPPVTPLPPVPPAPSVKPLPNRPANSSGNERVAQAQRMMNHLYHANLSEDGVLGPKTRQAAIRVLQGEINAYKHSGLAVDGVLGSKTQNALPTLRTGDQGNLVQLLQIFLLLNGYDPGLIDSVYGPKTRTAVTIFQRDNFLVPDGVAGPRTFIYLLQ